MGLGRKSFILLGLGLAYLAWLTKLFGILNARMASSSILATPTVTLRQGTFKGTTSQSTWLPQVLDIFLGIPYALAPAGERRFGLPVGVKASTETFNAVHWGHRCPSDGVQTPDIPEGEDCLNLNIFRPRQRDPNKKLPVVVYVHGGSFNYGSGKGSGLTTLIAWSTEPLIGVSFNYRIGALGFLPSKALAKEGLLNLGLKDQSSLLEWVQENISAFGGNPDDVTLMGSSAGAHSVGHHIMANTSSKPLFHKAIMESGASTARAVYPYDHVLHQTQFQEFLQETGSSNVSESEIIPHLKSLPFSTISSASQSIYRRYDPSLRWAFQPVIDGHGGFIPEAPIEAWQNGDWHKMPILTGFNTNEGSMFVPTGMSKSNEFRDFFHILLPALSTQDLDALESIYPDPLTLPSSSPYVETRPDRGAEFKRVEAAYAQFAYIAPVRHTVHFASAASLPQAPAFLYHFALSRSINGGANHGDQRPFVSYSEDVVKHSKTQDEIAGQMHAYITSFITTGDPNTIRGNWPRRPPWPVYKAGAGEKMVFGEGNTEWIGGADRGISAKAAPDTWAQKECDYWWSKTIASERKIKSRL